MFEYLTTLRNYGPASFSNATAASSQLAKDFQKVADDAQKYTKKSFDDAQAYIQKLSSVQSMDDAIKANSDFFSAAHGDFLDHANKLGDVYFNFTKRALKLDIGQSPSPQ